MQLERINSGKYCPEQAAEDVLKGMIELSHAPMAGVHDAHVTAAAGKAYAVFEANDEFAGETCDSDAEYCVLAVVDLGAMKVVKTVKFAASGMAYRNTALPPGCCFVPRILNMGNGFLRVFFASQQHGVRQEQLWYMDYDLKQEDFSWEIFKLKLMSENGLEDMTAHAFYAQAAAKGFSRPERDYGMYLMEIKKPVNGKTYVAVNNYLGKQNALACFREGFDTVEILANVNEPQTLELSESDILAMPGGGILMMLRCDDDDRNYRFSFSPDGRHFPPAEEIPLVQNGSNSKPVLDCLNGLFFLGWQEKPERTRFNFELSEDGVHWERGFSFHLPGSSFQYPSLCAWEGHVYIAATVMQKERILFGRLL